MCFVLLANNNVDTAAIHPSGQSPVVVLRLHQAPVSAGELIKCSSPGPTRDFGSVVLGRAWESQFSKPLP